MAAARQRGRHLRDGRAVVDAALSALAGYQRAADDGPGHAGRAPDRWRRPPRVPQRRARRRAAVRGDQGVRPCRRWFVPGDIARDRGHAFSRERFAASCTAMLRSGFPVLLLGELDGASHATCAVGFRSTTPPLAPQGKVVHHDAEVPFIYIHDGNLGAQRAVRRRRQRRRRREPSARRAAARGRHGDPRSHARLSRVRAEPPRGRRARGAAHLARRAPRRRARHRKQGQHRVPGRPGLAARPVDDDAVRAAARLPRPASSSRSAAPRRPCSAAPGSR